MTNILDNPLSIIPFIIANVFSAHVSVRPPRPPADSQEQKKYKEHKANDILSSVTFITVPTWMTTNFLLGVCDVYMILSAVYPVIRIPRLHHALLSSPATAPKPSDFYLSHRFLCASTAVWSGAFLRYLCYRTLGRHFTFELSLQKGHRLVTNGPYAYVRHPSYLAFVIMTTGMVVAQLFSPGTWWVESGMWRTQQGQVFGMFWLMFVSYVTYGLLSRVPKEDLLMRTEFKDEWVRWAEKTKYAVIPFVW